MAINRANQTRPADVVTMLWEKAADKIQGRLIAALPRDARAAELERIRIYQKYAACEQLYPGQTIDTDERKQRCGNTE